ncbi:MAG TPA: ankyrin repeat domain-containing protein, partial [Candidatus Ozemobacteraceae bacterium]|nr:ankyrin repeat domain-containing protein [Candidatus Ozemobacteraceae bacterium]
RPDSAGNQPLHLAAASGQQRTVKLLLGRGADFTARNADGKSALDLLEDAVRAGRKSVGRSPAEAALQQGRETTRLFLRAALLEEARSAVLRGDADFLARILDVMPEAARSKTLGLTPLHLAAVKNRAEACRILLDAGCDVDVTGFTSRDGSAESTPLHLAAESGARDVVELLISRGANVNAVNNFHRTPLFWAKKAGKTDVAELLAAHGAVADPSEIPTTPPASGTEETPASR